MCVCRVNMTEVEPVLDFASSGRTGRRNALPDILGSPAGVSPSDLPLKLAEMSLSPELPLFQFEPITLCPITAGPDEEPISSILVAPFRHWKLL
uniref:Uncharacterized protein n=1 Tax=Amazona collaria TaxID=241587 RepID=A0A8B9GH26_9PSIT